MSCASSGFGIVGRTVPTWTEDTHADTEPANPNILHTIGRRWRLILAATLLAFAAWHFGHAAYVHVKSRLAQYFTASAWQQTRPHYATVKLLQRAGTWPIARPESASHSA